MPNPRRFLLPALALAAVSLCAQARAELPTFTQIVIFGDSLSDTGNDADVANDKFGIRFPSTSFNYADGRFTDSTGTSPAATLYTGVWHEQLASLFLGMTPANPSLDGGTDYAFGGATTESGQSTQSASDTVSINVDNMGRQLSTYLDAHPAADAGALYIVWGGANDIFNDATGPNVTAAAARESTLVRRLGEAGAKYILVPNLPPLGYTPSYNVDAATSTAYNDVSGSFRDQLNADLDDIQTVLTGEGFTPTIYRLDVYDLFMRLHANPSEYGFADITHSAQDSSANPDTSIFWDNVHPTTAGHFQLAAEAYTLLSGVPVIEINPSPDKTGFYFVRTGTDLTTKLNATYAILGTATQGTEYLALSGKVRIKPGKQVAKVAVTPTTEAIPGHKVKIKLLPGATYVRPVVKKAVIKLD